MAAGVTDGALVIDTGLNNSGFIRDARQFRRAVETLTQAVQTSGQQMSGGMDGYLRSLQRAGAAARGEQASIQKAIDKTSAAIARLEERQELARRKFEAGREDAIARAQEQFQERNAGAELMPWENEATALEQLSEDMNLAAQAASDAYGVFEDTTAFRNMSVEADFLRERLAALQEQLAAAQSGGGEDAGVASQLEQTVEAAEHVATAENGAVQAGNGLQGAFAGIASGAGSALGQLARMAGSGAVNFLKKIASGAKNAAIQLAKMAGRAIGNGVKKIGGMIAGAAKSMLGLNKASKAADGGLKKGLMSILKYGLGIRGLFALFRKLRTAIKEGLEAMAQNNPQLKASLDSLKASLNGLKGSLATAFAPIVTAVAPALTKLIGMLTSAINSVGAFIAALTGQKTYQKAVAGLEATGDAASGAAGSVKDLKRELAGFDQLNILGKSDSGNGSSSGSGNGTAYHYEAEEIGGGITDFVAKLKELWANADYDGVGREIAGAINGAFEKAKTLISWDSLGGKITEAVDAVTGVFNGLVDGINWDLIGRTFGTGINTILNTINQLLTKVDWANLGVKLAEGLSGLVDEVDWELLGDTIGQRFAAAVAVIGNFLLTFDWANLGSKMATGINSLFNKLLEAVQSINWGEVGARIGTGLSNLATGINWDNIGATLAAGFNAVLAVISEAIKNFNFVDAGKQFGSGLSRMLNDIDWASVGRTISNAAKGALDFLISAIREFDWNKLAVNIKTFLQSVDWAGVAGKVMDLLSTALGAALGTIGKVVADLISEGFKGIKKYFDDSIEAAGGDVVAGIFNGIVNAIKGIGTWIYEHIFKPFIDAFKNAFGIHSPASTMEEPGENIVKGIFDGIVNALKNIGAWVKNNIFDPIWNAIKTAGATVIEITVSLVKKIGEWAADAWAAIQAGAETIGKTIQAGISWLTNIAETVVSWLISGAKTIKKTVSAGLAWASALAKKVVDWLMSLVKTIKKTVSAGLAWASDLAKKVVDWLMSLVKTIKKTVSAGLAWASALAKKVVDWLMSLVKTIKKTVSAGLAWASDLAKKVVDWLMSLVKTIKKNVSAGLTWASALAQKVVDWLMSLVKTIKKNVSAGLTWASALAQKVVDWLMSLVKTIKKNVSAGLTWASALAQKVVDWLMSLVKTIKKNVSAGLTWASALAQKVVDWLMSLVKTIKKNVSAGLTWATDLVKTVISWLSNGSEIVKKTMSAGLSWATDTAKNIITWIAKVADGAISIGVKIVETVSKWFKDFVTWINGGGEEVKAQGASWGDPPDITADVTLNPQISDNGDVKLVYDGWGNWTVDENIGATAEVGLSQGWTGSPTGAVGLDNLETDTRVGLVKWWQGTVLDWLGLSNLETNVKVIPTVPKGSSKIVLATDAHDANTWTVAVQALGGIFQNGFWRSIPQYAKGTHNAHGSLFLAGEAGPEVVGHVGGRTEVLNKSQLASTMFSAVSNGMLAALRRVEFRMPAMATGSVMPYDVSAQLAKSTADLQGTLDANNEDLIQTIISVAGQIVAAIGSVQARQGQGGVGGLSAQQVISEINRRSQMMGVSPLIGG